MLFPRANMFSCQTIAVYPIPPKYNPAPILPSGAMMMNAIIAQWLEKEADQLPPNKSEAALGLYVHTVLRIILYLFSDGYTNPSCFNISLDNSPAWIYEWFPPHFPSHVFPPDFVFYTYSVFEAGIYVACPMLLFNIENMWENCHSFWMCSLQFFLCLH